MRRYRKFAMGFVLAEVVLVLFCNIYIQSIYKNKEQREYAVEVSRIVRRMEAGEKKVPLVDYPHILEVKKFVPGAENKATYVVESVGGELYQFSYCTENTGTVYVVMNVALAGMVLATIFLLYYLGKKMMRPFIQSVDLPQELAKGNLSVPIPEEKSKLWGKFLWGMDMLREKLEEDKQRELALLRERKMLILSLSHDIKTPLSAIDLYAKALGHKLYDSEEKQREAYDGIAKNVEEIRHYVDEITTASKKDFLTLQVNVAEVYLADVVKNIRAYYKSKMEQMHTRFLIEKVDNCLLKGDADRMVEVLQNVIENALKYGDGEEIGIRFSEEEDCRLITVYNTGEGVAEEEMPHLFDSFYRGKNSAHIAGSGLGLYICKELMHKMDGDLFAKNKKGIFSITLVFKKC